MKDMEGAELGEILRRDWMRTTWEVFCGASNLGIEKRACTEG